MKSEKNRLHGQRTEWINENISNYINVELIIGQLEFCKICVLGSGPCKSLNKLNSCTFTTILAGETHYFIIALQVILFHVIKRPVNCILMN